MTFRKALIGALLAVALAVSFLPQLLHTVVLAQANVKNYFSSCSGVNCDNTFNITGTLSATSVATLTGFVSAPSNATYKVARGVTTLDGANPTPAATALTTIVACAASYTGTVAPGLDPALVTTSITGATLDIYAWKPTTAADGTQIASTNAARAVSWVCVGT